MQIDTSEFGLSDAHYSTEYIQSLHGNPVWEAIWGVIKQWDVSRMANGIYAGATGDDATAIFEAVQAALAQKETTYVGADYHHDTSLAGVCARGDVSCEHRAVCVEHGAEA